MSSLRLKRIVSAHFPALWPKFEKANIQKASDFFSRSELELMMQLDCHLTELGQVTNVICQTVLNAIPSDHSGSPVTAWELLQYVQQEKKSFLHALDYVFIPAASIIELAGVSGSGKSQCCLQLAVQAVLPKEHGGLDGSVVYFDTEMRFSPERLIEISHNRFPHLFGPQNDPDLTSLLARIRVIQDADPVSLLQKIENLEETIIEHRVKLIIIDSIAHPLRREFDGRDRGQGGTRHEILLKIASLLKQYGHAFNFPCVVTNQASSFSSSFPSHPNASSSSSSSSSSALLSQYSASSASSTSSASSSSAAALGATWAHAVNIRYVFEENQQGRFIRIAKSPFHANDAIPFVITTAGLQVQELQ